MEKNKILIVDDNPNILNIIVDVLSKINNNYSFFIANNGNTAYKIATDRIPDLIITDWEMPEMNGISLLKKLKTNYNTELIPVIIATGVMLSSDNLKTAFDAGAVDYIKKPIDKIELAARVQSMLMLSETYKKIVENHKKELTKVTMKLVHTCELNEKITTDLQKLNQYTNFTGNEMIRKIIRRYKTHSKDINWKEFEFRFNEVYKNFYKNLNENYPNLTKNERKLCAFIRLGMDTKKISSITFQKPSSIDMARYRLRKKFNVPKYGSLTNFIFKI